jgi:hypothetical protein
VRMAQNPGWQERAMGASQRFGARGLAHFPLALSIGSGMLLGFRGSYVECLRSCLSFVLRPYMGRPVYRGTCLPAAGCREAVELDLLGGYPRSLIRTSKSRTGLLRCIRPSPGYRSVRRLRVDGDAATVGGAALEELRAP